MIYKNRKFSVVFVKIFVYGCINATMAELSSQSSIRPSKHSHTNYSARLFLRLPSPLLPVIFIVTCQSFRSHHVKFIIIHFLCTKQPSQPHEKVTWVRDHVSRHKCNTTALQMLVFVADNNDGTFQMLSQRLKEFVQLHKVLDLMSVNNFNEKIH